jgi:Leucine-rich repeat (LRR) protein
MDVVHTIEGLRKREHKKFVIDDLLLRNVPSTISVLQRQLTQLCISEIDMRHLNQNISHLSGLQELQILKCPLKHLPEWVKEFKQLKILQVVRCNIKSIPEEISECKQLEQLVLDWNRIEYIPASVLKLNIIRLSLDGK